MDFVIKGMVFVRLSIFNLFFTMGDWGCCQASRPVQNPDSGRTIVTWVTVSAHNRPKKLSPSTDIFSYRPL
jgi:hypothetical protein